MQKVELSFEEYKQIADLVYHPGYKLLLEALKANLDTLGQILQDSSSSEELKILGKWRAFNDIYTFLVLEPEKIAEYAREKEVEQENKMPNRTFPQWSNLSPQNIDRLKKEYEERTGKKVVIT